MAISLGIETTPRPRVSDATGILWHPVDGLQADGQGSPGTSMDFGMASGPYQNERERGLQYSRGENARGDFRRLAKSPKATRTELKRAKPCWARQSAWQDEQA